MNTPQHPVIEDLTRKLDQAKHVIARGGVLVPTTNNPEKFLILYNMVSRETIGPQEATRSGDELKIGHRLFKIISEDKALEGRVKTFGLKDSRDGSELWVATNIALTNIPYLFTSENGRWDYC